MISILSKEEQGERLKYVRKSLGWSQDKIAKSVGITQPGWGKAEKGQNALKIVHLQKLEKHGINIRYITHGEGELYKKDNEKKLSTIRLISGSVLAGLSHNNPIQEHNIEDTFYMPLDKNKEYYAIKVEGRSMEPQIIEGSTLVIEEMKDKSQFKNNKVYVIIVEGIAFVKRIQMLLGGENRGKFEVSSDNEEKIQVVSGDDISSWYKVSHVINQI